jgi:hypothetical protein
MTASKKWTDELVAELRDVAGVEVPVPVNTVIAAAKMLDMTERRIAAKLRQLDYEVESMAKNKTSTFSDEETAELIEFVNANAGTYTYSEIAEQFHDGAFLPKQIQGKILALELTGSVKPTEQVAKAKEYTDAEEAKFIELANAGSYIEDIAAALNREIPSIRGKALSLSTQGKINGIPTQRDSAAKNDTDPYEELGDTIHSMTVKQIAESLDKTPRGVKTTLTRRGITVADYDGAAKQAKAQAKKAA